MKNIMICSLLLLQAGMIFAADAGQKTPRGQESSRLIHEPGFGLPAPKQRASGVSTTPTMHPRSLVVTFDRMAQQNANKNAEDTVVTMFEECNLQQD